MTARGRRTDPKRCPAIWPGSNMPRRARARACRTPDRRSDGIRVGSSFESQRRGHRSRRGPRSMGLWRDRAVRALPFVAVTQRASAAGPRGVRTKLARAHAPRSGGVPVGACRRPTRRACTTGARTRTSGARRVGASGGNARNASPIGLSTIGVAALVHLHLIFTRLFHSCQMRPRKVSNPCTFSVWLLKGAPSPSGRGISMIEACRGLMRRGLHG